jgi:Zn-finger nucleic acid-binding protein
MKCPTDDSVLQLSERQGIEIDYCPTCRGVWLDRGELDKLIERSATDAAARTPVTSPDRRSDRDYGHDHDDGRAKKRKKGSFLGEIFEF